MTNLLYSNVLGVIENNQPFRNHRQSSKEFGGLLGMTTLSDRTDLRQMPQFNKSSSVMERSLEFLKSTQNEIYYKLHKELDDLKLENKELKLKLVLLSNSPEILTSYPEFDPIVSMRNEGIHARLLGQRINELSEFLSKENALNLQLEKKIQNQEQEIFNLKNEYKKKEVPEKTIPNDVPILPQPSLFQTTFNDVQKLNKKLILATNRFQMESIGFPPTLQGCYVLIRSLIKSKDKLNNEKIILEKKLDEFKQYFERKEFMISKNLTNKNVTSFSIVSNNSNSKRLNNCLQCVISNYVGVEIFN